jgi:hypothetical protein
MEQSQNASEFAAMQLQAKAGDHESELADGVYLIVWL